MYLYLGIGPKVVSSVLIRQEAGAQHPVYYISRVLNPSEVNYSIIVKYIYALGIASRKLRPYFHAHEITVYTDQPLKHFQCVDSRRCMPMC